MEVKRVDDDDIRSVENMDVVCVDDTEHNSDGAEGDTKNEEKNEDKTGGGYELGKSKCQ